MIKKLVTILSIVIFSFSGGSVSAQTASSSATPTVETTTAPTVDNSGELRELNKKISELEGKVAETRAQGNSLASQISTMDNQIKLTEYRVNSTKKEVMELTMDIDSATKRMGNLENSLTNVTKVLLNRIVATYQAGDADEIQILMRSDSVSDLLSRSNYLKLVQQHDKRLLYDAQQARNDYANQKQILESKKQKIETLKAQLEDYTKELDVDKINKQKLLADTKGNEAHYQQMLSQARAQVNAFKTFATSSGGSILPPQSSPDGWYYNQRDSRWGSNHIGSSPESVWEVGCLLSSVAMVLKKHGQGVTPADIAANSSYFFSNTAFMNLPWGGGKFSSSWGYNQSAIDSKLAGGEPVIVGVKGGSHFIVLKSGSAGNYIMNDPWNGPDLKFSDYYSSISQYGWYNG